MTDKRVTFVYFACPLKAVCIIFVLFSNGMCKLRPAVYYCLFCSAAFKYLHLATVLL